MYKQNLFGTAEVAKSLSTNH